MGGAGQYSTTGVWAASCRCATTTYQISDNLFWQHGRHSIKVGAEVMSPFQYNRWEVPSSLGIFTFSSGGITSRTASNDGTGDILATTLLGLPQIANRTLGPDRIFGRQQIYQRLRAGQLPHAADRDLEHRHPLRAGAAGL